MNSITSPSSFSDKFHSPQLLLSIAIRSKHGQRRLITSSAMASNDSNSFHMKQRRSANYHPSIWNPKLMESLTTPYTYELYGNRLEDLIQKAKGCFASTKETCDRLKLIDSVQRLGVAYHFKEEIEAAIDVLREDDTIKDLKATTLHFRLLREHGYRISTGVFDKFRDKDGRFNESLAGDIAGLLNLYEASFLGIQEEDDLEEAKSFSTKYLKEYLVTNKLDNNIVAEQIQQALEMPLHWRVPKIEALNFINLYPIGEGKSSVLLELAKLDFNLVQSLYQQDLIELARWWSQLGFKEKLSFSRDRLMESYFIAMCIGFEPQFSNCRICLTKLISIVMAIDDMYDIYGSVDELELFTHAIKRWEISAVEELPDYMKICYLAIFNFGNGLAYDVLKSHGFNALSYISKEWANLCTSFLVEAKWSSKGYTPTVEEYLENASISVAAPITVVHAYLQQLHGCNLLAKNSLNCLKDGYETIYWSSLISRHSNDLATFKQEMKRGDTANSIKCYMLEEGISEEETRDHIKRSVSYSWKKLNENIIFTESSEGYFSKTMVTICLNVARISQCIYNNGDGVGSSIGVTKDCLASLLLKPIPIEQ